MKLGCAGVFLCALVVAGCESGPVAEGELITGAIAPPLEHPQDEPVALGKTHYAAGDYGLAERYFRRAVELNAQSAEAWLGLAASYDGLRRFDLADRAYASVLRIQGRSPAVLNNLGYHYMLMGNLGKAADCLSEAARKDPGNPLIEGNLQLLATWRSGDQG